LAKKNDLVELEINNVTVDGKTIEIIKTFRKLQLLVVSTRNCKFTSPNELPLKLTTLKLKGFHISQRQVVSLIKQREHLEKVLLADCILNSKKSFHSIADSIVQGCNLKQNRKVNLILTTSGEKSSKVSNSTNERFELVFNVKFFLQKTVTTSCISISNHLRNANDYRILFPGLHI
jgi:hypothetical protein